MPPTKKQSKQQNSITNTINLHCFLSCFCSTLTMKPETNQLVTTNSNHFPTNQKCNLIIGSYLLQHRACKKTLIALETRLMRISLHIAHTINMHTKTNSRYCYHHRCSLCIKRQKPIYLNCMCSKPRIQRNNYRRSQNQYFIKNLITKGHSCKQTCNCYNTTTTCTNPTTHLTSQCTTQKRCKKSSLIHLCLVWSSTEDRTIWLGQSPSKAGDFVQAKRTGPTLSDARDKVLVLRAGTDFVGCVSAQFSDKVGTVISKIEPQTPTFNKKI